MLGLGNRIGIDFCSAPVRGKNVCVARAQFDLPDKGLVMVARCLAAKFLRHHTLKAGVGPQPSFIGNSSIS